MQIKSDRIEGSNHFYKNITIRNNGFKRSLDEATVVSDCENIVLKTTWLIKRGGV